MREILFRAKLADEDTWVEGSLVVWKGDTMIYTDRGFPHFMGNFLVEPETVGQFTGLTDKNGTKIFEEDIVEGLDYDEENGFGVVYWEDGAFFVGNSSWCGTFCENYNGIDFEVIGNIHDNPELIGGADND